MTIALFALLIALNIADAYYTRKILAAGGRELNPAMRWMMAQFGVNTALIVSKGFALGLVVLFACHTAILIVLCGVYSVVVGINAEVYHNMMREK